MIVGRSTYTPRGGTMLNQLISLVSFVIAILAILAGVLTGSLLLTEFAIFSILVAMWFDWRGTKE